MNQKYPLKAWAILMMLSFIWGSSFILIKKGLIGLAPLEVATLRIFSASVFLIPIGVSHLRKVTTRELKYLLSVGMLGSFAPALLFAVAQTHIDSAIAGVLNAVTPLFTMLIGLIVFRQKKPLLAFVGVIIGFAGSAILILSGAEGSMGKLNLYALLVISAAVFYAVNTNIIKYKLQQLRAMTITSVSLGIAGPIALTILLLFTDFSDKIFDSAIVQESTIYVIVLGVLGTGFATFVFNHLVRMTDPVFSASVTYIIPMVAVSWGMIDGEKLQWVHFIGIATILTGVYITNSVKK